MGDLEVYEDPSQGGPGYLPPSKMSNMQLLQVLMYKDGVVWAEFEYELAEVLEEILKRMGGNK